MTDQWDNLAAAGPSRFHLPASASRCSTNTAKLCRICGTWPDKSTIHPVQVYRLWDKFFSGTFEYRHQATPWLMVEPFLESHGYRLKKLRDKGPCWEEMGDLLWFHAFDGSRLSSHTYPAFDKDGRSVFIKTVPLRFDDSHEYAIWRLLHKEKFRLDPRNHTVPAREVLSFTPNFASTGFSPLESDWRAFVVMDEFPRLRDPDDHGDPDPTGQAITDLNGLLSLTLDLLRCLEFLHEHGIAHRDLRQDNMVYDDRRGHWTLIDFQLSRYFPKPWADPPRVLPISTQTEPEARLTAPYDPFLADIYCLGMLLDDMRCIERIGDTRGLLEIFSRMTKTNPQERISMQEAIQKVEAIKPTCLATDPIGTTASRAVPWFIYTLLFLAAIVLWIHLRFLI